MTAGETVSRRLPSRIITVSEIPESGRRVEIDAGPEARAAIAEHLDAPAVDALIGEFEIFKTAEGAALEGRIEARLQRDCVVSLERFVEEIAETFEIRFSRAAARGAEDAEIEIDFDAPEPLEGDSIDLGEILVHQLALAMDPYPRKPDAKPLAEEFGGETRISPFSGLARAFAKPGKAD